MPKRPKITVLGLAFLAGLTTAGAGQRPPATPNQNLQALVEDHHWKRARPLAERLYQTNPNDPAAAYWLSQVELAFGDLAASRSLAEKAASLEPKNSNYHLQLAEACGLTAEKASLLSKAHWAGKFKEEAETAVRLDPRNLDARFDLLEFYLQAPHLMGGGQDKARNMADEISKIDPVSGFLAKARLAREQKDWPNERQAWARAAASGPRSYDDMIDIASFYLGPASPPNGQAAANQIDPPASPALAEKFARQAATLNPDRTAAYGVLARLYALEQRWQDLDSVLMKAEKNVPDNFRPYYRAAEALLAKGTDLPRAERYFRKYLSQEPEPDSPTPSEARRQLDLVLAKEGRKP